MIETHACYFIFTLVFIKCIIEKYIGLFSFIKSNMHFNFGITVSACNSLSRNFFKLPSASAHFNVKYSARATSKI